MSENLSFLLVLSAIHFFYRTFKYKDYLSNILTGLFLGLSYLTKVVNILLVPIVLIVSAITLYSEPQRKKEFTKKALVLLVFFLVSLPVLLSNSSKFESVSAIFLGHYDDEISRVTTISLAGNYEEESSRVTTISTLTFIYWFFAYFGYVLIGSGAILLIYFIKFLRNENSQIKWILLFTGLFLLGVASYHASVSGLVKYFFHGRAIGRYISPLITLSALFGGIELFRNRIKATSKQKIILISLVSLFAIFIIPLNITDLFPANNIALAYWGAFGRLISQNIILTSFFSILLATVFISIINLKSKTVWASLFLFFILTSLISFSMTIYNAQIQWKDSEYRKVGLWFNDKEGDILIIDKETRETITNKKLRIIHTIFWLKNDVYFEGDPSKFDYVLTKEELDLPLLKQFNDLRIYSENKRINED